MLQYHPENRGNISLNRRMRKDSYHSGQKAVELDDEGTGFVYYPNGKICISVIGSSSELKSFYVFSPTGAKTLLVHDEASGRGHAGSRHTDSVAFNKEGIRVADSEGKIICDMSWESASSQLPYRLELSSMLSLTLRGRLDISLRFQHENIEVTLNLRVVTQDKIHNYLSKASKGLDGKLLIPLEHRMSLLQRQREFNERMADKKNLVRPRSDNLVITKHVVGFLESHLDPVPSRLKTSSSMESIWREDARQLTLRELPSIPLSGTEVGESRGLGSYARDDSASRYEPPRYLLTAQGQFKNDLAIVKAIREIHPPLHRGRMISTTSGRYSGMLVVDPKKINPFNPSGMTTVKGCALEEVTWEDFKTRIGPSKDSKLHVLLIARQTEHEGYYYKRVAEEVNATIYEDYEKKQRYRLHFCEVADNTEALQVLNIKTHPAFLMTSNGLVGYFGKCGGKMLPKRSATPIVMIIEPNIKFQSGLESGLRRNGFQTILCLSIFQAMTYLDSFVSECSTGHNTSGIRAVLISSEANGAEISLLSKKLAHPLLEDVELIALLKVLDNGLPNSSNIIWDENFICSDVQKLLKLPMADHVKSVTLKPLKTKTIQYLKKNRDMGDGCYGLCASSLIRSMHATAESMRGAAYSPCNIETFIFRISLSSEDNHNNRLLLN